MRKRTIEKKCINCQKIMYMPYWLSLTRNMCSYKCSGEKKRKENFAKKSTNCLYCGVLFLGTTSSKGKFCSHSCYSKSKSYGDKPKCLQCSKTLSSHRCTYCIKCYGKMRTGSLHWNWQGGKSNNRDIHSLNNQEYKQWRNSVFTRDKYSCRIKDKNCGGALEAHHILRWALFPELRYQTNNGITLCHAHHPRKVAEEKRLEPLFKELVSASK